MESGADWKGWGGEGLKHRNVQVAITFEDPDEVAQNEEAFNNSQPYCNACYHGSNL